MDQCDSPHEARGLCNAHYKRARYHGQIENATPATVHERFWAKVNQTNACWLWTAAQTGNGYGVFGAVAGKLILAHRFSYEEVHGSIPNGLWLDHLCRVRNCVRPSHLEAVTPGENIRRGHAARRRIWDGWQWRPLLGNECATDSDAWPPGEVGGRMYRRVKPVESH